MPNRFLRDSICSSDDIDSLSLFEEVFFYRFLVVCDDFGRMDGRTQIIKSRVFPLRESISLEEIDSAIRKLESLNMIFTYEVKGKPYIQVRAWERYQQRRAAASKYPDPIGYHLVDKEYIPDIGRTRPEPNENHLISDDINGYQKESDDNKFARITINDKRETINDDRDSFITTEEADAILRDHDKLLTAAEKAGFPRTDAMRAKLLDLYSDHGMEKMLAAIDACVEHGACNIAYLKGVLRGEPKKNVTVSTAKTVPAQKYAQRSYDNAQEEALRAMIQQAKDMKNGGSDS